MSVEDTILASLAADQPHRITVAALTRLATITGRVHTFRRTHLTEQAAHEVESLLIAARPSAADRVRHGQPIPAVLTQIDKERDTDRRLLGLPVETGRVTPGEEGDLGYDLIAFRARAGLT